MADRNGNGKKKSGDKKDGKRRSLKDRAKALAAKLKGRSRKSEPFVPKAGIGSHNRYAEGGRARPAKG